jgi:hypothetical protein
MGCFVPTDLTAWWPLLAVKRSKGQLVIESKIDHVMQKIVNVCLAHRSSLMTLIIKE